MDWGMEDFAAATALLGVSGVALVFALTSGHSRFLRVLLAVGVVSVALAIWAHLAVGIF